MGCGGTVRVPTSFFEEVDYKVQGKKKTTSLPFEVVAVLWNRGLVYGVPFYMMAQFSAKTFTWTDVIAWV